MAAKSDARNSRQNRRVNSICIDAGQTRFAVRAFARKTKILVENADIDGNDDALVLKAGRDSDGLRVNRPTEDVVIRDCIVRHGAAAITIGSETSGGFRNIEAYNITALSGVPSGILFKSASMRGGFAKDIRIHDLTLQGVAIPIHITMNWNPSFSYAVVPEGMNNIPSYWVTLGTKVPREKGLPHFSDVHIWNIKATGAKPRSMWQPIPTPRSTASASITSISKQTRPEPLPTPATGPSPKAPSRPPTEASPSSPTPPSKIQKDIPYGEPK